MKHLLFHIDFQNWAKRFWNLGPKFERYCPCCLINSLRNFLMIMFFKEVLIFFAFWVFDWNLFRISTVIFRQGCQNCYLHFWVETLTYEKFSSKNTILLIFYSLNQIISETFWAKLSKLLSRCREGGVEYFFKLFSIICLIFYLTFLWPLLKTKVVVKTALLVAWKLFWSYNLFSI